MKKENMVVTDVCEVEEEKEKDFEWMDLVSQNHKGVRWL